MSTLAWLLIAAEETAEEGLRIIIGMLLVGLVFIGVIALGELSNHLQHRRRRR